MIREAIDKILSLAHPTTIEVNGKRYAKDGLKVVPAPTPAGLHLTSLTALLQYLHSELDGKAHGEKVALLVSGPDIVQAIWPLNPADLSRGVPVVANPVIPRFGFGDWHEHERFCIALQTCFVPTEALGALIKVVAHVTADEIATSVDDGVTQTVTAKAGVQLLDRVSLPSPVTLRPYRTFHEVPQPESPFVLRARKDRTGGVSFALFEADGGAWRAVAIDCVATYLRSGLPRDLLSSGAVTVLA
jgi:hypothetical protein